MDVTAIDAIPMRWPLSEPIADARSLIAARTAVLVRISTTSPTVTGWGEAACFGGVEALTAAAVHHLANMVVDKPVEPRHTMRELRRSTAHYRGGTITSALSGIEIALWDAMGKHVGASVSELFGIHPRPIPTYRTIGFYQPGESADMASDTLVAALTARHEADRGGVKIKVGRFGVADDIRRTRLAREAIGMHRVLIVDANNAYDFAQARQFCKAIAEFDVKFVEEPIEFGDAYTSARLREASPVPIGGYELDADFDACRNYVDNAAVDFIQPDAIWSGGIAECVSITDYASRQGITTIPHNFSTLVGTAANYHLACIANSPLLEIDGTGSNPLSDSTLLDEKHSWNSELMLAGRPGLGLPPDIEALIEAAAGG